MKSIWLAAAVSLAVPVFAWAQGSQPVVDGVTFVSSPHNGNAYVFGEIISVRISFDQSVWPSEAEKRDLIKLKLTIGTNTREAGLLSLTPINDNLIFDYVVAYSDRDADGISIAADALTLNGGTIRNAADSNANLDLGSHAISNDGNHKVDGSTDLKPNVTSVSVVSRPQSGDTYAKGEVIRVQVRFHEAVMRIDGNPQLALTLGTQTKQANYLDCRSGFIFSANFCRLAFFGYIVQSADSDSDGVSISANALTLNGAVIRDASGTNANLSLSGHTVSNVAGHKVSGSINRLPNVAMMRTSSPQSGDTYNVGETIEATITFSRLVKVTGAPQLALGVGTQTKQAAYSDCLRDSQTDPAGLCEALKFQYVVQSSDSDADGISIAADALTLNGGTIQGAAGSNANLNLGTHALTNSASRKVDGSVDRAPAVSTLTFSYDSRPQTGNTYGVTEIVEIRVSFTEPVRVSGSPQLSLTIGTQTRQASLHGCVLSCRILNFQYVVQASDTDSNGISIGANSIALNGGAIQDSGGNSANLDHDAIGDTASRKVDGSIDHPPTITRIWYQPKRQRTNTYGATEAIQVKVDFSEPVTVTGNPQLLLTIGAQTKQADYDSCTRSAQSPAQGCVFTGFRYVVQASDRDTDGVSIAANALRLNGGKIQDAAGNNANLNHDALGDDSARRVDGSIDHVPAVIETIIDSDPRSGDTYIADELIEVGVRFDEPVIVSGSPQLALTVGSQTRQAKLHPGYGVDSGQSTNEGSVGWYFRYIVLASDRDTDGISVATNALTLNGGTIRDISGNNANLMLTRDAVSDDSDHKVDGSTDLSPIINDSIFSKPQEGDTFGVGETIEIRFKVNEPVSITGTPQLALQVGAQIHQVEHARCVAYFAAPEGSCRWLLFRYVVQAADSDSDGVSFTANALTLNGGTIRDAGGNNLNLMVDETYLDTSGDKVDGSIDRAPAVGSVSISSSPQNGNAYGVGESIEFTVTFNEPVTVSGQPQLSLTVGTRTRQAAYQPCSKNPGDADGTCREIVFRYVVQQGDNDANGISTGELTLNGGTIQDSGNNNAVLDLGEHAISDASAHNVAGGSSPPPPPPPPSGGGGGGGGGAPPPPANEAPKVLGDIPLQRLAVDASVQIDLAAHFSDPDGDPLTYEVTLTNATVATATVSGDAMNIAVHSPGWTWIYITARDPRKQKAVLSFLVLASVPPSIVREIPDVSLAIGGSAQFDLADHFFNPEDSPLTYTAESSNPDVANVAMAALRGSIMSLEAHSSGTTEVSVTAANSYELSITLTFTATVSAPPEVVGEIEDLTLTSGTSMRIDLAGKFSDPENGSLAYVAESTAPDIATVSTDGGTVTIAAKSPGVTTVTVTASDPNDLSASLAFSVTVTATARTRWGGWRSALLRQPTVKTGDES